MTTITKKDFINQFTSSAGDPALDVDTLKKAGIKAKDLANIDIDKDGKIKGTEELGKLFDAVDTFDTDGSKGSLETAISMRYGGSIETTSGAVFNALKLEFDRRMTQAKMKGPQKPVAPTNADNTANKIDSSQKPKSNEPSLAQLHYAKLTKGLPPMNRETALADMANFHTANHRSYWINIEGLAEAHRKGLINDKDLENTIKRVVAEDPTMITRAARYISRMPDGDEKFKNEFLQATMKLYEQQKEGSPEAAGLATSAAEIIGRDSEENQLKFLSGLNKQQKLDRFIKDATSSRMYNEVETAPGWEHVDNLKKFEEWKVRSQWPPDKIIAYSSTPAGVANLAKTLAYAGPQDSRSKPLPVSQQELQEMRLKMFNSASDVYSDSKRIGFWDQNTDLKDGLSKILQEDFDQIWSKELGKNKAWISRDVRERLEGFFQHALFTKPTGILRDSTSEFVADHMKNWLKDINDKSSLDDKAFEKKYGMDRTQLTHVLGKTMGLVKNGMDAAIESAKTKAAKEAARKTAFQFFIDLGLNIIPGGGGVRSVLGLEKAKIVGQIVEGISGEVIDKLKDMTKEQAAEFLAKKYPGLSPDKSREKLFEYIGESINVDYLSDFQSSYSIVDGDSTVD